MRGDIFLRLPPPTALLLLAHIFDLTQAHAIPPQTSTVPHRALNVVAYPPLPTQPPVSPAELRALLRRQDTNTVCGFIGGDPKLPATCSAGSHCVLDADHGVVGCCPNGEATCTTGVFTGCVDFNSGAQTEANPYVFTCQGSDVCYKNVFGGGLSQFGCGTASDLATTVEASATGITHALSISSLSVGFTRSATSLATPTSIDPSTGTRSFTRSTGSTKAPTSTTAKTATTSTGKSTTSSSTSKSTASSSSSTSSKTSSSSSSTSSSSSSKTSTSSTTSRTSTASATLQTAAASSGPSVDRTGAIVGGTISGVAILIALIALGIYCMRRRRRNVRQGPGPQGSTEYISPMSRGPQGFAPLHQSNEHYETGLHPGYGTGAMGAGGLGGPYDGTTPANGNYSQYQQHPATGQAYDYPGRHPAAYAGAGVVGLTAANMEADRVPLTREIDDFSHSFNTALDRIGEEDEFQDARDGSGAALGANQGNGVHGTAHHADVEADDGDLGTQGSTSTAGMRPLWQQNRRQSRNLMWM